MCHLFFPHFPLLLPHFPRSPHYFRWFDIRNSEFRNPNFGVSFSLFLNKALGGLGALPLGGAGLENRRPAVSLRSPCRQPDRCQGSRRVPKGALTDFDETARRRQGDGGGPSRPKRVPKGALEVPKWSPREPSRSERVPKGAFEGPKGSSREFQHRKYIGFYRASSKIHRVLPSELENTSGFTERASSTPKFSISLKKSQKLTLKGAFDARKGPQGTL